LLPGQKEVEWVSRPSRLRAAVEQTRREAERLARQARQAHVSSGSSVRFSGRRNIVVATNVGEPGATHRSVAVQSAPITQHDR
jgi:hypothetical protein